jgi:hypothetical protein
VSERCGCFFTVRHGIQFCTLHLAAPHLLDACKAQRQAIDLLMAKLGTADRKFLPSESGAWDAVLKGNAAIKAAVSE